jgi:hypothetical protein
MEGARRYRSRTYTAVNSSRTFPSHTAAKATDRAKTDRIIDSSVILPAFNMEPYFALIKGSL